MIHPAALSAKALLDQCDVRFARRSGPGGQNRNKVETAAILNHRPTGLIAEANERRSQAQNREAALFRLRLLLALRERSSGDPPLRPTDLWRSRCPSGRIRINPEHEDFPAILAEVLDTIATHGYDLHAAATWLATTSSQLLKILRAEPRALLTVNEERRARGLLGLM